ncbi:fused response regulator/phosphatase [Paenibacillus aurantius]|uniref:Fused response regulator/phosphatase n=1 Tax=Paenibacillus aurantius TaxID=2918900 RepID=A0AA96RGY3_9BACL|nr:fused response regulator/phosphatase [Paenibacillus aurantius]WJH35264.1 fused response regulator/phosphatase [Paenibacillus sp. CC-CFT747]WNQ10544.1 fused response regulator/phosphatase [Paenibacillus aurantius]
MSILIVDDNPVNLIIIEKILKSEGYTDCITASSAYELFDHLKLGSGEQPELQADLILMDMMMPEIDGLEACRRIQQEEKLKDIPIIIVTALGDSNKLAEALDVGAIDYVMKPINKVELMARIRVALRLKYEKDWHIERDRKIRNELDLAKQVQRSVLSQPLDDEAISIAATYYPSFELAGDMYSWYKIDENRYGIILLDMMGHGISSSLVCMFISSVLQDTITRLVDPELVINELNRYMNQLYSQEHFIHYYFTAIYLVIDTKNKTIEYVNAGHPPGLVIRDGEETVELDKGSCAVGFFEQIEINKAKLEYKENIRIFLFTDGLLEAVEDMGQDLTEELVSNNTGNLMNVIDRILPEDVRDDQHDDMCMVMVRTK